MRRLAFLSLLALGACAGDPGWFNPNLPKAQAADDYAACRRTAEQDAGGSYYQPPGDERSSDPMRMAEAEREGKRFNAYVGACMREQGYFPKH